ncbi:MAG: LysR family transcriptional regulator [Alphaproteobacteria bacterium]|nr:LysR family transcriptional regulator [Alphaproteobacteria bacterium]
MPSPERLQEFTVVAQRGSISAAARSLGLPRATLSRRMSGLEEELGVRLLHRTSRRMVLTPAGEELLRRARRLVADTEEAWAAVRRLDDVPRGLLRISSTSGFLDALVVAYLEEFPEVQIEVRSTTRHVDLVGEGVDVALRFGEVRDPNLIVRKVAAGRRHVVGSPAYFARRGRPAHAEDLSEHSCLVGFAGEFDPRRRWPLVAGGEVEVGGRLAANDIRVLAAGARAGLGLALLPDAAVASSVEAGELEVVLEGIVEADASVSIVYADREFIEPRVRVFVDRAVGFLRNRFPV